MPDHPSTLCHSGLRPERRSLEVHGLGVSGHGSLLESLRQRGVGVASSGNVLARGTVLESQSGLSNHLTGARSNDVGAEKTIGLRIGKNLDETLRVEVGLGSGVGAEGESADLVGDVLALKVLL